MSDGSVVEVCIQLFLSGSFGLSFFWIDAANTDFFLIFVRCSRSVFNVWRHLNHIHIYITLHRFVKIQDMDEILCRTVFLRSFNVLACLDSID